MKVPRDLSGRELVKALEKFGYLVQRQKGSHCYLVSSNGEHHIAVPLHNPLKLGTLMGILNDIGSHSGLTRADLINRLFE